MAKGQQKSNREAKKPKATKKPATASASSYLQSGAPSPTKSTKK